MCVASKLTASLLFSGLVFSTRRHTFTSPAPSVVITSFLQGCTARHRMRSRCGFAIYLTAKHHSHPEQPVGLHAHRLHVHASEAALVVMTRARGLHTHLAHHAALPVAYGVVALQ